MKRGHGYRYSALKPKSSKEGKISLGMAVLSGGLLLFCVIASALSAGKGTAYIGAVGLGAGLFALYGTVLGLKALQEKKNRSRLTIAGAIISGILFVLWLAVFIIGLKG